MIYRSKLDEAYIDKKLNDFASKYRTQFKSLQGSMLQKVRGITDNDYFALGEKLEKFDNLVSGLNEADVNQLGVLPKIALDVIAVNYGTSPISLFASEQSIDEEVGIIYYRDIRAKNTRGNATAGETLVSPRDGIAKTLQGYAAAGLTNVLAGTGNNVLTTFNFATNKPLKKESVFISLQGSTTIKGQDDGNGFIIGYGVDGTVDYVTGAIALNFSVAPATGVQVFVSYIENLEASADISEVEMFINHKIIKAEPYALKGTIGLFQNFGLNKRLGLNGGAELESMLVTELNKEITGKAIRLLDAAAGGTGTFDLTVLPSGVSYQEHKLQLKDKIATLDSVILSQAKRGQASVMIMGYRAAEISSTLPGFVKISDSKAFGPHLYGTLDGMPIVRVPEAATLAPTRVLGINKGDALDSALVRSTFMPIVTTGLIPLGPNPLTDQNAVAAWEGLEVVQAGFIAKLDLTVPAL